MMLYYGMRFIHGSVFSYSFIYFHSCMTIFLYEHSTIYVSTNLLMEDFDFFDTTHSSAKTYVPFTLGRFVSVLANESMTAKSFNSNSRSYVTMKLLSCSVEQLFLLPKEIVVFKKSYSSEANMAETKQVGILINSPKQYQPSNNPHQETNMLVTLWDPPD